jgi:hypothetical protein
LIQINNNLDGAPEEMTKVGERISDILIFNRPR